MRHRLLPLALLLLPLGLGAAPPVADAPVLRLPLQCTLGRNCWVQNYVDDDPGPGVRDAGCGARSYPAHSGTDFRLASLAAQAEGMKVLAAAAGTVLRLRDGVPDHAPADRVAATRAGQECGNGVVVGHPGGWETQYCHMAQGSLAVREGQSVAAGAVLGEVGMSGDTEFPHLHLSVRQGTTMVDPFAYGARAGQCPGGRSLWAADQRGALAYRRGEIVNAGFATVPPTAASVEESGDTPEPRPSRDAPALIAFVRAIGLERGDVATLSLSGLGGAPIASLTLPPLDRDKATWLALAGRRRPAAGWPAGRYTARYAVLRAGKPILTRSFETAL